MKERDLYNIRYGSLTRVAGWLMLFECALMLLPLTVAICLGESDWHSLLIGAGASGGAGAIAVAFTRGEHTRLSRREGYLLISVIWILFSLFGMLPFIFCKTPLGVSDAFFETMSGFTTTGATVISDVESMSRSLLLWRALIQWIGGLGIVLFLIAVLPALNDSGGISLFNAEITGMTHDKLHPQIRRTAASLWAVYLVLTLLLIPLLMIGGMSCFDSLCQSLTTLSTGGFSTRNASIGAWGSPYIASVMSVFMLLGGVNFILLYNMSRGHWESVRRNDVIRIYLLFILIATAVIALCLGLGGIASGGDGLVVQPLFQVASAITSTGFTYGDFSVWGPLPLLTVMLLMLTGSCAGSTTGGIKIDRIVALIKNLKSEIIYTLYPNHIIRIKVGGNWVQDRVLMRVMGFITIYLITVFFGAAAMSAYGYEAIDSLFASASCMGNSGLGYGATGAGFGALPAPLKWIFSFQMLIGRLEIFTVLVLFYRPFWKR